MQAIVYTAPLTLELQDVPEPVPADGEVLVEVRAAGICGSELEGFKSQSPFRVPPLIMGHELAGVRLDTGEAVAVNPLISCGTCDLCLRGEGNLCRTRACSASTAPAASPSWSRCPSAASIRPATWRPSGPRSPSRSRTPSTRCGWRSATTRSRSGWE